MNADTYSTAATTRNQQHHPQLLTIARATGLYIGVSDNPDAAVEHVYVRVDDLDDDVVYRYRGRGGETLERTEAP
jgi:hypothetical protein